MITDFLSNKKLNPIVTELFIRGRKLNISLVFITQSYIAVPKNIRLNPTHYIVMNPPNKKESLLHSKFHLIIHPILTFKVTMYYKTILLVIDFKKNLFERI